MHRRELILRNNLLLAAVAALCFIPFAAQAGENMIGVGVGYYDIFDEDEAADFRVEYRHGDPVLWEIKPFAGAHVTTDGAVYGLGGFYGDFNLSPEWTLTPSLAAGLYSDGGGKDLGHTIEFRSQLELGYNFQNGSRVTTGLAHISNASIGDRNPGTEILSLNYYFPLRWISSGE